jgi:metal-responsive CopG/Arc/MetJ family transcriptional regulator
MMMRIDEDLLEQIDERAAKQKTSRSAWISRICAYGIENGFVNTLS